MVDITDVKRISRAVGLGDADSALFNLFYGVNHFGVGDLVPANQDHQGYTFVTKPNLNLSKDNIKGVRKLQYLLDDDPNSMASAIRCSLMPRTIPPRNMGMVAGDGSADSVIGVRSNAINDRYPFISFLPSTMLTLTGWPDEITESFESNPGIAKEVVSWVDSRANSYAAFDLDFTCSSRVGDPHMALIQAWREYACGVAIGEMHPWPESENEFEIDYHTRIYTILMDKNKKYFQKIACTGGGAYPKGIPSGAAFNQDTTQAFSKENDTITIPFKAVGFRYNDPQIIVDFNKLVAMYHPGMRSVMKEREDYTKDPGVIDELIKIPDIYKALMNFKGYPYMNPFTSELEWWVEETVYDAILSVQVVDDNDEVDDE